jgi:hypothetical protein
MIINYVVKSFSKKHGWIHHASYAVKLNVSKCSPLTMARLTADHVSGKVFEQDESGVESEIYDSLKS